MNIYDFGYGTYDGSNYEQVYHEEKYTPEEFADIIIKASIQAVDREYSRRSKAIEEAETLADKKYLEENDPHISFQWLMRDVTEIFLSEYGFKRVEYTASFTVDGDDELAYHREERRKPEVVRLSEAIRAHLAVKEKPEELQPTAA